MSLESFTHNKNIVPDLELTKHETMLLKSLEEFYEKDNNFYRLKSIIDGESNISRRTIEFFVTNYSKKVRVLIDYQNSVFNVHSSYKDQLKAHKKKYFDIWFNNKFVSNNYLLKTWKKYLRVYPRIFIEPVFNYLIKNKNLDFLTDYRSWKIELKNTQYMDIYKVLKMNSIPRKNDGCDTCSYVETRSEISLNN